MLVCFLALELEDKIKTWITMNNKQGNSEPGSVQKKLNLPSSICFVQTRPDIFYHVICKSVGHFPLYRASSRLNLNWHLRDYAFMVSPFSLLMLS